MICLNQHYFPLVYKCLNFSIIYSWSIWPVADIGTCFQPPPHQGNILHWILVILSSLKSVKHLLFLCFFPLFVVSNIQVDEETLSGKYLECMSKRDQYPLAHIYEYSKCKSSLSSPLLKLPAIWSSFLLFISSLHLINSCTLSYSLLTIILIWASSTALVDGSISSNICHVCVSKVTFSVGSVRCLCCFIMFPLKKFHNM